MFEDRIHGEGLISSRTITGTPMAGAERSVIVSAALGDLILRGGCWANRLAGSVLAQDGEDLGARMSRSGGGVPSHVLVEAVIREADKRDITVEAGQDLRLKKSPIQGEKSLGKLNGDTPSDTPMAMPAPDRVAGGSLQALIGNLSAAAQALASAAGTGSTRSHDSAAKLVKSPDVFAPKNLEEEVSQWPDWSFSFKVFVGFIDPTYAEELKKVVEEEGTHQGDHEKSSSSNAPPAKNETGQVRQITAEAARQARRVEMTQEWNDEDEELNFVRLCQEFEGLVQGELRRVEEFDISSSDEVEEIEEEPTDGLMEWYQGWWFLETEVERSVRMVSEGDDVRRTAREVDACEVVLDSGADCHVLPMDWAEEVGETSNFEYHLKDAQGKVIPTLPVRQNVTFVFTKESGKKLKITDSAVCGNVTQPLFAVGKMWKLGWGTVNEDGRLWLKKGSVRIPIYFKRNSSMARMCIRRLEGEEMTVQPVRLERELKNELKSKEDEDGWFVLNDGTPARFDWFMGKTFDPTGQFPNRLYEGAGDEGDYFPYRTTLLGKMKRSGERVLNEVDWKSMDFFECTEIWKDRERVQLGASPQARFEVMVTLLEKGLKEPSDYGLLTNLEELERELAQEGVPMEVTGTSSGSKDKKESEKEAYQPELLQLSVGAPWDHQLKALRFKKKRIVPIDDGPGLPRLAVEADKRVEEEKRSEPSPQSDRQGSSSSSSKSSSLSGATPEAMDDESDDDDDDPGEVRTKRKAEDELVPDEMTLEEFQREVAKRNAEEEGSAARVEYHIRRFAKSEDPEEHGDEYVDLDETQLFLEESREFQSKWNEKVCETEEDLTVTCMDLVAGADLTCPERHRDLLQKAKDGFYHAAHSGFPCGTFSRLRWKETPGQPGPVRSREHIYGLPTNTPEQQAQADKGTVMACLTLEILRAVEESQQLDGIVRPTTIENPPETDHPEAGSAFYLPEIYQWTEREHVEFADFNTCVYAAEGEPKHKKPQRFVGRLAGLHGLTATCRCPPGFKHPAVDYTNSAASARYPKGLCTEYAKLLAAVWEKGAKPAPNNEAKVIEEAEWKGGDGKFGPLRKEKSKKATRDEENKASLGGLRRPTWASERVPGLRDVGNKVSECFDEFCKSHPGAAKAAEGYGTSDFHLEGVVEWKQALEKHFGLEDREPALSLKGLLDYKTPVNVNLLEAWAKASGDPDEEVAHRLRTGAPLGANLPIRTCGVFPAKEEDDPKSFEAAVAAEEWAKQNNYKSFADNQRDADAEMAERYFSRPVVSKLGLIVKEKPDGSKKRRVIVDALRSGANAQAVCPERIVLPRQEDVHGFLREMKRLEPDLRRWYFDNKMERTEWSAEFAAADLVDAFTHYPVAEAELTQCISPAGDGKHVYVFVALFFGHKTAPLLMCRLSALFTRLLQGMYWKAELQMATYVDDPLAAVGSRPRRRDASGTCVQMELRWREGALLCEVPDKLRLEILGYLDKWTGMIPVSELRSVTGKLTWAAGIYRRAKWAVSMLYAALAAHEAEIKSGEEAARRGKRSDQRNKDHLIPVKRFEAARRWLAELFRVQRLATKKTLWNPSDHVMFITDTSPQGCGGLFLTRATSTSSWTVLRAYEYEVDEHDAKLLNFEYGSHKSQAFLEALAVLLALREWGTLFAGIDVGLAIRSDSTVALSVVDKEASSSPALNSIAAEISLLLERHKIGHVTLQHIPGKLNKLADFLSRPKSRGEVPAELAEVKSAKPRRLSQDDFCLGTPGSHDASTVLGLNTMELVLRTPAAPALPQEDATAWILLCGCAAWTALTLPPAAAWSAYRFLLWAPNMARDTEEDGLFIESTMQEPLQNDFKVLFTGLHRGRGQTTAQQGPLRDLGPGTKETPTSSQRDTQKDPGARSFMGRTLETGLFSHFGHRGHPDEQCRGGGADNKGIWPTGLSAANTAIEPYGSLTSIGGQRALQNLAPRNLVSDLRTDKENKKVLGKAGFFSASLSFETTTFTTRRKGGRGADVRLPLPGPIAAPNHRGSKFAKALEIAASEPDLQKALEDFEGDFFSKTNVAPRARRHKDALDLATALNSGRDPFPLVPAVVLKFAAALKKAEFKSGVQYLSALRVLQAEMDFAVGPAVARAFTLAKRSLNRNVGPGKKAPECQPENFKEKKKYNLKPGHLAFPYLTYALATAFMLRLIEFCELTWQDVIIAEDGSSVGLILEKSKMDQEAKGIKRTLGCTCGTNPKGCPVEIAKMLKAAHASSEALGPPEGKSLLAVTSEGRPAPDELVVASWAFAAGLPLQGHSARRSGALRYVRLGLSIPEITYLGRWHSDLVFKYAEEAWEDKAWRAPGQDRKRAPKKVANAPVAALEDLDNAPTPVAALEDHSDAPKLPTGSRSHEGGGGGVCAQLEILVDRPKWVQTFGRSKVIHLMDPSPAVSSAQWKTKCGWPFARTAHFSLFSTPPSSLKRCMKCRLHWKGIAASHDTRETDAVNAEGLSAAGEAKGLQLHPDALGENSPL
ncbi:unnamed protein product [Symbiodinium sp. CCMP2592]|nr:unnamed protein product [Symbiodinium sp. CCMP2592]